MESLVSIEQIERKKAYVVTMLGTCTQYTPSKDQTRWELVDERGIKTDIPYTELLGFISEQIVDPTPNAPQQNPFADPLNRYQCAQGKYSPSCSVARYRITDASATVINGVDVAGMAVNHRIAMGVNEALFALYHGYDEINLIGHSRGAVECIIIAHELERIKSSLTSEITFEEFKKIYLQSPINNLRPEASYLNINIWLNVMIAQDNTQVNTEEFNAFLTRLSELRVNIFALDPVPGGEKDTLLLKGLWWQDERYFHIPKIVKDYMQIVLENDHSPGFRPIIPNCNETSTRSQIFNLLGHHGSASGNPLNHKNQISVKGKNVDDTRESQYIAMAKLIDFLENNNIQFKEPSNNNIFLSNEFYQYLMAQRSERDSILLVYYERMKKFLGSYQAFEQTSYVLITENAHIKPFTSHDYHRYIYKFCKDKKGVMSSDVGSEFKEFIPEKKKSNRMIINLDHALLILGLSNQVALTPILLLEVLMKNLYTQEIENRYHIFQIKECCKSFRALVKELSSQVERSQYEGFERIYQSLKGLADKNINGLNILECFLLIETFELFKSLVSKYNPDVLYLESLEQIKIHLSERYHELKPSSKLLSLPHYKELRFQFGELSRKYNSAHQELRHQIADLHLQNQHFQDTIAQYQTRLNNKHQEITQFITNHEIYSGLALGSMLSSILISPLVLLSAQAVMPTIIICAILLTLSIILQILVWNKSYQLDRFEDNVPQPNV